MKALLFSFLVFSFFSSLAQGEALVNPNGSLLNLNPSFAGSNGGIRNQLSTRHEVLAFDWNESQIGNNLDGYIKSLNAGIGLSTYFASRNIKGIIVKNSSYALTYAQNIKIKGSQWIFIPSLQMAYVNRKVDYSNFDWYVPDPKGGSFSNFENTSQSYVDGSAGFLMKYKNDLNGGIYFFHITQFNRNLSERERIPLNLTMHTSYSLHFGDKTLLQLMAVYKEIDGFPQFQFNATFVANHFIAGAGITDRYGPSCMLGYRANRITISGGLEQYISIYHGNFGTAELNLAYNLRSKENRNAFTNIESW